MYTGKWVWRLIAVTVIASSAACGGGGSGGAAPGTGENNGDLPNMGLQGTLYYQSNAILAKLNLADPKIGSLIGHSSFSSSVSMDGTEFIMNTIDQTTSYPNNYKQIDIFRIDGPLVNSFSVGAQTYGAILLSPDNQLVAIGHKPEYGYKVKDVARGVRIYDRNGGLMREFLDGQDGPYHSDWAWTRDGRLILSYASSGIYIVDDVLVSEPRLIRSFDGKTALYLDVSPDNSKIAFTFYEKEQAFVMSMNGTELRQVTVSTDPAIDNTVVEGISWSPDGGYLALVAAAPYYRRLCTGVDLLVVKSDSIEAQLPDLSESHSQFRSTDTFYVEIWSQSHLLISAGTCPKGDVDWRE
jgi:WD40 repeat protein